ncbi:MAG: DUF4845 domain-containing protein [Pseudomonadota bacterium]|jgi:hypothetical protein|nr:MAG: hypothetical protein DIU62_06575 [Pseudomonadota bacterium]
MRKRQAGITFIGWVVLLIPMAIVLYMAIRLIPIYLNHVKVANAVEQAAQEARTETSVNPGAVRTSISRRFNVEGIETPSVDQIRVARDGSEWVIEVNYEQVAPLFADINLLVTFDRRVVIQ